ncbi:MAG: ABC transporter substrate-binding protein [Gammaproteobacteria bacterium]
MTRKHAGVVIAMALVMMAPLVTEAQETVKVARIGILRPGSPPDPYVDVFRQGLQELGYTEGRNISIEIRWAEGRDERLADLAADLIRLKVDVIVAGGTATVEAAKATTTIPIVMPASSDPVRLGLAASFARPGGNVTGLALLSEELPGKWMELLKEILPKISRVAVLSDPQYTADQLSVSETAARSLGLRLQVLNVSRPEELATAFAEAKKNRAQALIVLSSALFYAHRAELVSLAAKQRLPTIYHQKEFVVGSGGLISYGPNFNELFRRAAGYVDKILKGAKPGDLPIEQPTKFELVINLKTAKVLGIAIPQSIPLRADEVIR